MNNMSKIRTDIFLSPLFIVSLVVLLINDNYLKGAYGNWFTGKLSDFAGLFFFTLFWCAFFPKRSTLIAYLVSFFFLYWKSPASEPFIQVWNEVFYFYNIGRVVDYTDCIALIMVPLAVLYFKGQGILEYRKVFVTPVVVLSLFAILGTSDRHMSKGTVGGEYVIWIDAPVTGQKYDKSSGCEGRDKNLEEILKALNIIAENIKMGSYAFDQKGNRIGGTFLVDESGNKIESVMSKSFSVEGLCKPKPFSSSFYLGRPGSYGYHFSMALHMNQITNVKSHPQGVYYDKSKSDKNGYSTNVKNLESAVLKVVVQWYERDVDGRFLDPFGKHKFDSAEAVKEITSDLGWMLTKSLGPGVKVRVEIVNEK